MRYVKAYRARLSVAVRSGSFATTLFVLFRKGTEAHRHEAPDFATVLVHELAGVADLLSATLASGYDRMAALVGAPASHKRSRMTLSRSL
jgi:hypothetical protein